MALPALPRTAIERNLYIANGFPCRPTRRARKITGPGLLARMAIATSSMSGLSRMSAAEAAPMSNSRLPIPDHPPYRHEHFGRLQAGLGAPVVRAIAQRFQRTWVGVVANLALGARHRLHLRVERVGDVNPCVRDERSWVSPLGAAGGVEGVDQLDEVLCRPGRDEQCLKDQVVVSVHVPAVLPVDDLGADLANDRLYGADHVGQLDHVQTLVGEAEQSDVLDAQATGGGLDV